MLGLKLASLAGFFLATTLVLMPSVAHASDLRAMYNSLEARYAHAHSLGDNYQFDTREGWQSVNVSNLQYRYSRDYEDLGDVEQDEELNTLEKRASKKKSTSKTKTSSNSSKSKSKSNSTSSSKSKSKTSSTASKVSKVTSSFQKVVNTIKGIGKPEPVTITWYTGHDLENPSCWANSVWAPTDASFACALTLEGWTTKPKCFQFLELCSNSKKCVFVRVVDSCAGCAKASKHVDLTQAAFKELADLDTGLLTVQMRPATNPDGWLENLWGPKT